MKKFDFLESLGDLNDHHLVSFVMLVQTAMVCDSRQGWRSAFHIARTNLGCNGIHVPDEDLHANKNPGSMPEWAQQILMAATQRWIVRMDFDRFWHEEDKIRNSSYARYAVDNGIVTMRNLDGTVAAPVELAKLFDDGSGELKLIAGNYEPIDMSLWPHRKRIRRDRLFGGPIPGNADGAAPLALQMALGSSDGCKGYVDSLLNAHGSETYKRMIEGRFITNLDTHQTYSRDDVKRAADQALPRYADKSSKFYKHLKSTQGQGIRHEFPNYASRKLDLEAREKMMEAYAGRHDVMDPSQISDAIAYLTAPFNKNGDNTLVDGRKLITQETVQEVTQEGFKIVMYNGNTSRLENANGCFAEPLLPLQAPVPVSQLAEHRRWAVCEVTVPMSELIGKYSDTKDHALYWGVYDTLYDALEPWTKSGALRLRAHAPCEEVSNMMRIIEIAELEPFTATERARMLETIQNLYPLVQPLF